MVFVICDVFFPAAPPRCFSVVCTGGVQSKSIRRRHIRDIDDDMSDQMVSISVEEQAGLICSRICRRLCVCRRGRHFLTFFMMKGATVFVFGTQPVQRNAMK